MSAVPGRAEAPSDATPRATVAKKATAAERVKRAARPLGLPLYLAPVLVWGGAGSLVAAMTAGTCGLATVGGLLSLALVTSPMAPWVFLGSALVGYVGLYVLLFGLYTPYYWAYLGAPVVVVSGLALLLRDRELLHAPDPLEGRVVLRFLGLGVRALGAWAAGLVASVALWVVQGAALGAAGLVVAVLGWGLCVRTIGRVPGTPSSPGLSDVVVPVAVGVFVGGTAWVYGMLSAFVPLGVHAAVLALFRVEELTSLIARSDVDPGPREDALEPEEL